MKNFKRFYLTHVFVEWRENSTDQFHLSLIPITTYLTGLLAKLFESDFHFEFHFVPWWNVQIVKN